MMAAALVLPLGMAGITEASATRRPSTPRTRSCVFDRVVVGAHFAGPHRMEVRAGSPGDKVAQAFLVLDVIAGQHLAGTPF
jgi:hypothetical protein